ncbi:MAG: hypothetical protein EOM91_21345 [Sphingobacteriia bacterium]|nr:hypothetical protein [Sphingobacteriia bacterium]
MTNVYDVIDASGAVVNVIVLDDPAAWTPPVGCTVRVHVPPEPPEPVVVDPTPVPLDGAALIDLCQSAGGMTDAMLVSAHQDPMLAAFWIKLGFAAQILPSDPRTQDGLAAVAALGYLPAGAATVLAAWPTA